MAVTSISPTSIDIQYRCRIEGMPPRITLSSIPPSLRIDNTAAWAGMGIYTLNALLARMAEKASQKTSEAISTIVSQGDQLMRIENHERDLIAKQAVANSWDSCDFEFMHNAPALPRVTYLPGSLKLDLQKSRIEIVKVASNGMNVNLLA